MTRVLAASVLLVASALVASCYRPRYRSGELLCALDAPRCPDGYYCAVDGRCWRTGETPGGTGLAQPSAVWIGPGGSGTADSGRTLNFSVGGSNTVENVTADSGRQLAGGLLSTNTDRGGEQ